MDKKITKATVKSFIRKNAGNLYLNCKSEFDGMTDGCESRFNGFKKAVLSDSPSAIENTFGITDGPWDTGTSTGTSAQFFNAYDDQNYSGYEIMNCCGRWVLAIRKWADVMYREAI